MATSNQSTQPDTVAAEFGGKWIAWDEQNIHIIASGETYEEAKRFAEATGESRPILESVPPSDSGFVGGI